MIDWIAAHPDLLLRTAGEHLRLSLVSLAACLLIGLPVGILIARHPRGAAPAMAAVNALRTVPSLALLVLLLPLLGTGAIPSCVALTLYGLPAVVLGAVSGLAGVPAAILDAARGQGLSDRALLREVALPLASPAIMAGIRNAAVQIVSAATLAVFIGGGGFGELISAGMGLMEIPQLVAGTLAVALMAAAAELGGGAAERGLAARYGTEPVR